MRKFLAIAVLMLSARAMAMTATVKLHMNDDKLWAAITVSDLQGCPSEGKVTVEWTPPAGDTFVPTKFDAPWHSCDADKGTAHTSANRRVTYRMEVNGKVYKYRATGVWHVAVKEGDKVLVEADYTVE